ncbi:MAG: tyrosine-type recombinase/integrase [Acidimicrobiia bacterium]
MRGYIRRPDGRRHQGWQAVCDVGPDPGTGRRRQRSRTFPTKREAEDWLASQVHSVRSGTYTDPEHLTLSEYLERWLAGLSLAVELGSLAANTVSWYRGAVRGHIVPCLGALRLRQLTPEVLAEFYADRLRRGRLDGQGGLSATSVRRLHVTLHRALAKAVRDGLLVRNPASLVDDKPRADTPDPTERVWGGRQLEAFLEYVAEDRLYAAWRLTAWTGMRRGEVCGLRWSDVDLDGARLSVRETRVLVDGRPERSQPKRDASRRSVELDPETVAALREWRRHQLEERLRWGEAWADTGFVFTREDGSPLRPDWLTKRFARLSVQAGLSRLTPHGLRHTHGTALLVAGVDSRIVQERLGHASVAITQDLYQSVLPGLQRQALRQLTEWLTEG